jgi:hypothetical protein
MRSKKKGQNDLQDLNLNELSMNDNYWLKRLTTQTFSIQGDTTGGVSIVSVFQFNLVLSLYFLNARNYFCCLLQEIIQNYQYSG